MNLFIFSKIMEAVMIPFQQYEYLSMLDEVFERFEIAHDIVNSKLFAGTHGCVQSCVIHAKTP